MIIFAIIAQIVAIKKLVFVLNQWINHHFFKVPNNCNICNESQRPNWMQTTVLPFCMIEVRGCVNLYWNREKHSKHLCIIYFLLLATLSLCSVNQKLASNKEVNSDEHLYLSLFTYSMLIRDLGIGYMLGHYTFCLAFVFYVSLLTAFLAFMVFQIHW